MAKGKDFSGFIDEAVQTNIRPNPVNVFLGIEKIAEDETEKVINKKIKAEIIKEPKAEVKSVGRKKTDPYDAKNKIKVLYFSQREIDLIEKSGIITMEDIKIVTRTKLREMGVNISLS